MTNEGPEPEVLIKVVEGQIEVYFNQTLDAMRMPPHTALELANALTLAAHAADANVTVIN